MSLSKAANQDYQVGRQEWHKQLEEVNEVCRLICRAAKTKRGTYDPDFLQRIVSDKKVQDLQLLDISPQFLKDRRCEAGCCVL